MAREEKGEGKAGEEGVGRTEIVVCVLLQVWVGYTVNTVRVCMSSNVYAYPFRYVDQYFL